MRQPTHIVRTEGAEVTRTMRGISADMSEVGEEVYDLISDWGIEAGEIVPVHVLETAVFLVKRLDGRDAIEGGRK